MNVVIAGLGGQGVLKASDILAEAALRAGYDVKKSELHGMSQRGGSVASDVRFGEQVLSPMIPAGQAHILVLLASDQAEPNRHRLTPQGVIIAPECIGESLLPNRRHLNVALLGVLSRHLEIADEAWRGALCHHFPGRHIEPNLHAFALGREAASSSQAHPATAGGAGQNST